MNPLLSVVLALSALSGWPLRPEPTVVTPFDPPAVAWLSGHRGVDLAGHPGQDVVAAKGGIVTFAGRVGGKPVVTVAHGETRTTYEPVEPAVRRGDVVSAGQLIGTLATDGSHCLPAACLHWGLVHGREYLDPLQLVDGRGRVRLLPLSSPPTLPTRDEVGPAPEVVAALERLAQIAARLPGAWFRPAGAPAGMPGGASRW